MSASTQQWEETKEYMDQMISMFRYDDGEKEVLNEIQSLRQQIADGLRRKEDDVRHHLRSLARQVESEESEGSQTDAIAAVRAEMEEADRQYAAVTAELNSLVQEKDTSEERLQRVKRELQELNNAIERAREQEEARLPTLRHSLSLYASITNIRWDYDASNVRGHVIPPSGKGQPHIIDLDPSAMSETQLADHLWAAVARASASAGE